MTDLDKLIWKASRGVQDATTVLLTKAFAEIEVLHAESRTLNQVAVQALARIEALEAKRGPGRPPKGP